MGGSRLKWVEIGFFFRRGDEVGWSWVEMINGHLPTKQTAHNIGSNEATIDNCLDNTGWQISKLNFDFVVS